MQWFVLDERARETGPMNEDSARGWVASGRCLAVRSEASKRWTPPGQSSFAAEERGPTLADMSPGDAGKLLANAIANGIFKASLAWLGLGILLAAAWRLLLN